VEVPVWVLGEESTFVYKTGPTKLLYIPEPDLKSVPLHADYGWYAYVSLGRAWLDTFIRRDAHFDSQVLYESMSDILGIVEDYKEYPDDCKKGPYALETLKWIEAEILDRGLITEYEIVKKHAEEWAE
jgi:hypothetical protein